MAFEFEEELGGISAYRHTGNGLRVLLAPLRGAPVATFMVTYLVGSRNERTGLTGATHFLEHLMFKGTETYQKAKGTSVFQVLQTVGAKVNATTWVDRTNYFAVTPAEHLTLVMDIEADRMRNLRLTPEDVEAERTVILNELDMGQNNPFTVLYQQVWATAFAVHPYHHPTIGWRSDVEQVTAEDLRGFYDTFYYPDNAVATVVGSFDPDTVLAQIEERFGGIAPGRAGRKDYIPQEPQQRGERRVTVRKADAAGSLMMAWKAVSATHPDAAALSVLGYVLGQGKSSRLHRALIDGGHAMWSMASATLLRDAGLWAIYAKPLPHTTLADLERLAQDEVDRVIADGIQPRELERARAALLASEAYSRDGAYSAASALNEAIAVGDWKLFATAKARVDAVTPEDLQRVAVQYLTEDTRTVGWHVI